MKIPAYFEEDAYLFYNSDIAAAVASGAIPSGYHHWLHHGLHESRAGAPHSHPANRAIFAPRCERRPYGVNLFGFLSTPSGLGQAARSSYAALTTTSCPFNPIDLPPWNVEAVRTPPDQRYRINLIQQNPDMLPLFVKAYGEEVLHGSYNIGFWFWELASARSDWHSYYAYADEIWVASEFCRRSFSSLTRLPVVRMPLVIEGLEKRIAHDRAHFGLPESPFLFGYIFDVNSYLQRKNPLALIEAFRKEFGASEEVLLVLKQSHGGTVRHSEAEVVEKAISGAANIKVLYREFTDAEVASFHNVLDCFVSPHRSEGFGFNLAESMYLNKPVIATGYSGNIDFMDDRNSYLIDHRLIPIEQTAGPYMKGSVWADPDIDHLQALMRRVFEDRGERESKAAKAADTIRRRFNSQEAGRRMEERFRELGLDQPRVQRSLFSRHLRAALSPFVHPATPPAVQSEVRGLRQKLVISVIIAVESIQPDQLKRQIDSVRGQWYPYWELCICNTGLSQPEVLAVLDAYRGLDPRIKIITSHEKPIASMKFNIAREISIGQYIAYLSKGQTLDPDQLLKYVRELISRADVSLRTKYDIMDKFAATPESELFPNNKSVRKQ